MAKNFGARKNSKYKVISSTPSVNKTPRGPNVVNVPYDVQQDLSKAEGTSPNVNFNGDPVYVKTSHSTKVTGDKQGSKGGVKSGTVEAQSDPIEASSSVFVNGKAVVRVGDKQHMQGKNTIGKVTSGESGSAAHITDEGKVVGLTQPEPIPKPYSKNKPTNNPMTSGALGSRTGSPVLLGSGKLLYSQTDVSLVAPMEILLSRVYVSDGRIGMFGVGWCSGYEQRLVRTDASTLTLVLPDDRSFRFKLSDDTFQDSDALGATLTSLEGGKFELVYFSDGKREMYDNGHLSHIQNRNGNTLTLIRTANGQLERIESGDSALSLTYNREGLVERVADHTGRVWKYTYDTKPDQELLSSIPSNLISVTDPLGGIKRFEYSHNLLIRCLEETGRELLRVTYSAQGKVATYTQEGETFSYTYQNNRTIKTHQDGSKTFYAVDNFGCISAITYPDASTTKEIFHNNTSTVRDRGENIHTSTYDERGRLIHYIYPGMDTREIVYTYEGENPFFSSVLKNEQTTSYGYEHFNLTSVTTPDGVVESFEYDERGNGISHTNREGITTQYAYNHQGQIIRSTDALGGITQYVYDELGNRTAIVDPMERIERFTYDRLDRIIGISNHTGIVSTFTYDPASRLIAIQDHVGNITRYTYDSLGYINSETLPDGQKRMITFQKGKLTSLRREDGVDFTFGYSLCGNMISKSVANRHTFYEYDALGNVLSIEKNIGSVIERIEYVYDLNANVVLERQGDERISYAYAHDGSKRFIGYEGMHYALKRDENRNLISITQGISKFTFDYNALSAQTSLTYPNEIQEASVFDALGRLTKREVFDHIDASELVYDKSSLIVSKNDIRYTYDESKQLIGESNTVYVYDVEGNRVDGNAPQCVYDVLGRLTQKQTLAFIATYEYDVEGYLVAYGKKSIHSSTSSPRTEDTTLKTVRPELVEGSLEINFTYDPLGRRRTKHYRDSTQEYHHRYGYSSEAIIAIYDNNTNELLATLLHDEAIDAPLSINVNPTQPMSQEESIAYEAMDASQQFIFTQSRIKRYYYHRDYQNSVIALSDDDGNIVEHYTYDAFGNITQEEHYDQINTLNPYRYTGREFDTDDLYYYRARYYDPTLGAFISPDPIGFLGGDMNLYRYVGNDPVNFVDPSGLIGMASALASAVQNRPDGSYDGNPFNGIVPNTAAPTPNIPNSNLLQGKTAVSESKPKAVEATSKSAAPAGKNGAKVLGSPETTFDIMDAYFAEQAEREVVAGTANYVFKNTNSTRSVDQKKHIAKIIHSKIKANHTTSYPTIASIQEALTQEHYTQGQSITFKLFKKEKYSKRISEASIGKKITLVAVLKRCIDGQSVTFKIHEKSPLLTTAGKELVVLKDGAEVTEVKATTKGNYAVVEVELRPKKDQKSSPTDTSPSLELWQEKFKHEANTPEVFDYLWINVTAPSATNSPMDCLTRDGEALKVKGGCELTEEKLSKIDPNTSKSNRDKHITGINATFLEFELNTCLRKVHFLAQVLHESAHLRTTSEYGGSSTAYAPFYGRGLIQITFEENYKAYGDSVNEDVFSSESNRQKLESNPHAAKSAGWFWSKKAFLNDEADKNDFLAIVYKVNGGFNGFDDRLKILKNAILEFSLIESTDFTIMQSWINDNAKAAFAWGLWHDPLVMPLNGNIVGCTKDKNKAIEGYKRAKTLLTSASNAKNYYSIHRHSELSIYKNIHGDINVYDFTNTRLGEL